MSLKCLTDADICILIISAQDMVTKQDKSIFNIIRDSNKPFILVVNKIDLVNKNDLSKLRKNIDYFSNILFGTKIIYLSTIKYNEKNYYGKTKKEAEKVLLTFSKILMSSKTLVPIPVPRLSVKICGFLSMR